MVLLNLQYNNFIKSYVKGKTQNHALYKAVHSLGYSVFIYLSLFTDTSYKHIQTIYQNDPENLSLSNIKT